LEELVNRLLPEEEPPCGAMRLPGAGDDRPLKRRGDKIGRDGLSCPICGERKLGIDYKPHRHSGGREWIVVAWCRTCQHDTDLDDIAHAVGMSPVEVRTGNGHLPTKYPPLEPEEPPPLDDIEEWHRRLMADSDRQRYLTEARGLSLDVIRANLIGHDGERYTFPIFDYSGPFAVVENVRRYLPDAGPDEPKWRSLARPGAWLYPDVPGDDRLIICEGEWDALLLRAHGFPAITNTAGALTWRDEWSERIGPRRFVFIIYDRDRAGVVGSKKIRDSLRRVGLVRSITVVRLPFPLREKHGLDVSDYFASSRTAEDFRRLLNAAYISRSRLGRCKPRNPHPASRSAVPPTTKENRTT
jgi:hypothetical protein